MKISFFFAWYDAWLGFYYDRSRHVLYVCPLPCFVFKISRNPSQRSADVTDSLEIYRQQMEYTARANGIPEEYFRSRR